MKKPNNHISIIGSTGLVGLEVTKKIINNGDFKIVTTASFNKKNYQKILNKNNHFFGDFNNPYSWRNILRKDPNIIVLISNCRHLLSLKKAIEDLNFNTNKTKLIIVCTTGIFSPVKKYSKIYKAIENQVKLLNFMEYIILRPNLIYGSRRDKNVNKVIKFINKYKFFPSLSNKKGKIQPLYYKDLVEAIVSSIYKSSLSGTFNITGQDCLDYNQFYEEIFKALDIKPRIVKVPYKLSLIIAKIFEFFKGSDFIINVERIERLKEIKCFSNLNSLKWKLYKPTSFEEGIRKQIKEFNQL